MLQYAFDFSSYTIQKSMKATRYDDKYKYFNCRSWHDSEFDIHKDSWNNIQMVSIKGEELCGIINARVCRDNYNVDDIYAINFGVNNYTFSKDFYEFLQSLFLKNKFNKVSLRAIKDNPANKMYKKYIEKYGGKIVGIKHNEVKLEDGEYYDEVLYEILRSEFMENYKK